MSLLRWLLPSAVALLTWLPFQALTQATPFVTPPYLQLGESFGQGELSVVWHGSPAGPALDLELRRGSAAAWQPIEAVERLEMIDRVVFTAALPVGQSGEPFAYRFLSDRQVVFEAGGFAPSLPGQPMRIVVTGDGGDGGEEQRALARQILAEHRAGPIALALLTGDLVYPCGQREEYDQSFFPVYNGDPGEADSAPLMRELPFVGALGNHDVGDKGFWIFDRCTPDYSYLAFWRHPSSRAPLPITPGHPPKSPADTFPYPAEALPDLLSGANFSFTWGDVHMAVLDSNKYVDWSDPDLLAWLNADLEGAQASRWRLVALHHPPFHLSDAHEEQQWMRALAPVFERHRVAMVIAGHVHNFQWLGGVRFTPDPEALAGFESGERGRLEGRLEFASSEAGTASGPVYVVSGAGGHNLKDQQMQCPHDLTPAPANCLTSVVVHGDGPSLTLLDVTPEALVLRQVTAGGEVLLTREVR